jgi:hypothetical protein
MDDSVNRQPPVAWTGVGLHREERDDAVNIDVQEGLRPISGQIVDAFDTKPA